MNPLAPAELILNPLNLINKIILNSYQPNTCFSQVYGSAPSGSDEDYYLDMSKAAAFGAKTDALAIELLSEKHAGVTWELVASAVPPIRKAGTRAVVGAGSDEGLLPSPSPILVYMENPCRKNQSQ